jgi:prepilin-type processing-associated H-X9-DG protein
MSDLPQTPGAPMGQPLRTGMAIAAMVLGILGVVTCIFPAGIVGLILGIIAVVRASNRPQVYGGRGMAIAGIVTGGLSILVAPMMVSILLPSLSRARELAKRTVSAANLKELAQAAKVYATDYGDVLPSDLETLVNIGGIPGKQLQNPSNDNAHNACDYYYVTGLTEADPADWVLAYGDPADHAGEGANIVFLDAHVEFVKEPQFSKVIQEFQEAYRQARGQPPTIIPPH